MPDADQRDLPDNSAVKWRERFYFCGSGLLAIVVFAATIWVARALLRTLQTDVPISAATLVLSVAAMILILGAAVAHEILYWRRPVAALRRLLSDIDAGRQPIESVRNLPRGLRSLAAPLHELLYQLRLKSSQIHQLDREMHQRVATRTESLERKLGAWQVKAMRDGLTGLSNRQTLDEQLPKMIEVARQTDRPLTLLLIDVDYFKLLNDTLGHQAGDEFLRSIGQVIRSTIRESDSAFRYGGDEFVVVLQTDSSNAITLAERLRSLVDGLTRHERTLTSRPQLSIGICGLTEAPPTTTAVELIALADKRLYAVKRARKPLRVA